jgi:hypothetical protein
MSDNRVKSFSCVFRSFGRRSERQPFGQTAGGVWFCEAVLVMIGVGDIWDSANDFDTESRDTKYLLQAINERSLALDYGLLLEFAYMKSDIMM